MKNLLLVTNTFPFGLAESSFLRPEIRELKNQFHITVIARNMTKEQTTELSDDISVYRYDSQKDYNTLALFVKTVFTADFYREILSLIKTKCFSFAKLNKLISYCMRSEHFAHYAENVRNKIHGDVVLYTYWNDYSVRSLSLIKKKKTIK